MKICLTHTIGCPPIVKLSPNVNMCTHKRMITRPCRATNHIFSHLTCLTHPSELFSQCFLKQETNPSINNTTDFYHVLVATFDCWLLVSLFDCQINVTFSSSNCPESFIEISASESDWKFFWQLYNIYFSLLLNKC